MTETNFESCYPRISRVLSDKILLEVSSKKILHQGEMKWININDADRFLTYDHIMSDTFSDSDT